MAEKFHQPIRMCISCRKREIQSNLIRLQYNDNSLEVYKMNGRSFYLCKDCVKEEKKVLKSLMRQCRSGDKDRLKNKLKEIVADDGES
ncbi:MAG: DUF448 domain-containing protein [Campylobacterota bacterium]|nr:DUF448 domain-containing protein [Campylobacterota bacterium]